jgi:hypothetical protein
MTRWSPDTCSCVVEYDSDDGGKTIRHTASISTCRKHARHAGQAHLDAVHQHNRSKNEVLNHLMDNGLAFDDLEVGYDPDALADDDPVVVKGATAAIDAKITAAMAKFTGRQKYLHRKD